MTRGLWPVFRQVARLGRSTPGAQLQRLMAQREPHLTQTMREFWPRWLAHINAGHSQTPKAIEAAAVHWLPILLTSSLGPDLRAAYHLGMVAARAMVKLVRPVPSLDYVGRRVPELASGMNQEVRDNISLVTELGAAAGWTPERIAGQIMDGLPLTTPSLEAVLRFQREGASDAAVEQYIETLTAARAQTIARTELSYAVNRGERDLWTLLVGRGELSVDTERIWVVEPDACPICEPYDGETVTLAEEFDEGDPPLHPNCRCVIQLFEPEGE